MNRRQLVSYICICLRSDDCYYTSYSLWKTLLYFHERMRVKATNMLVYENSFGLVDPRDLWIAFCELLVQSVPSPPSTPPVFPLPKYLLYTLLPASPRPTFAICFPLLHLHSFSLFSDHTMQLNYHLVIYVDFLKNTG